MLYCDGYLNDANVILYVLYIVFQKRLAVQHLFNIRTSRR